MQNRVETEIEIIRRECDEVRSLLRSIEALAIRARTAADAGESAFALSDVQRGAAAMKESLDRVIETAKRRGTAGAGRGAELPAPTPDLDDDDATQD